MTFVSCRHAARAADDAPKFRRPPNLDAPFIAALGQIRAPVGRRRRDRRCALWAEDPGPNGVPLGRFANLMERGGKAQAGWQFDKEDWWLEEHGLIVPKPDAPPAKRYDRAAGAVVPARRYAVTGDRELTTVLDGARRRQVGAGEGHAVRRDAPAVPQRAHGYTGAACTPAQADARQFPVKPGAAMPAVGGCAKQDYAVLFVVGIEA